MSAGKKCFDLKILKLIDYIVVVFLSFTGQQEGILPPVRDNRAPPARVSATYRYRLEPTNISVLITVMTPDINQFH